MRNPVFRRPGRRRHAGTANGRPHDATPEAVAGRNHTAQHCHTARYSTIANATAPHHLRGAIWVGHHRPPPHVATTQRGEIRGYAQLPSPPGIEITSPLQAMCRAACRSVKFFRLKIKGAAVGRIGPIGPIGKAAPAAKRCLSSATTMLQALLTQRTPRPPSDQSDWSDRSDRSDGDTTAAPTRCLRSATYWPHWPHWPYNPITS